MKLIVAAFVSCAYTVFAGGTDLTGISSTDPQDLAGRVVDNLLSRGYMLNGGVSGLHYAEACTAVGALRFADRAGNAKLLGRIVERYSPFLEKENVLVSRHPHVDHNVMGIVPLQIYLINGDERHLKLGLSFADQQWENPTEDGLTPQTRWWIDDMYMIGMLQIQAYRATDDAKYADRAAVQLAAYLEKLRQDNGLFYHGPRFHYHWGAAMAGWPPAWPRYSAPCLPNTA